jgi:hypothetical protein
VQTLVEVTVAAKALRSVLNSDLTALQAECDAG